MNWLGWFIGGFVVGYMAMAAHVVLNSDVSLSQCRASHPGYDCKMGWTVGEAFK